MSSAFKAPKRQVICNLMSQCPATILLLTVLSVTGIYGQTTVTKPIDESRLKAELQTSSREFVQKAKLVNVRSFQPCSLAAQRIISGSLRMRRTIDQRFCASLRMTPGRLEASLAQLDKSELLFVSLAHRNWTNASCDAKIRRTMSIC